MSRTDAQNCLLEGMGLQILKYFLTQADLIIRVTIFVPSTLEYIDRPYLCYLAKLKRNGYVCAVVSGAILTTSKSILCGSA